MQRFIDGYIDTGFDKISGAGKARRTGSDDRSSLPRFLNLKRLLPSASYRKIGDKTLQTTNRNRLEFVAYDAGSLTLHFLRTNTAANCGQCICIFEDCIGFLEVFACQSFDESRDVDFHRASGDAFGFLALQATISFRQCHP